ncbi:TPA: holin [Escherichia coli]
MRNCNYPAPAPGFCFVGGKSMFDRIREACAYVTGAVTAFFGAITINDIAVFVGILSTIGTFAVNYYFKSQENKRAQEEHDARMGNK